MEKERFSEKYAQDQVCTSRKKLECAGDQVILHSNKLLTKLIGFVGLSKRYDSKGRDLRRHLNETGAEFSLAVSTHESLQAIKGLTLVQWFESSDHGAKQHVNFIEGDYDGRKIRIYNLTSADMSTDVKSINRDVRLKKFKGYIDEEEIIEEAKTLYPKLITSLLMRNLDEKGCGVNYIPESRSAKEFFDIISAPKSIEEQKLFVETKVKQKVENARADLLHAGATIVFHDEKNINYEKEKNNSKQQKKNYHPGRLFNEKIEEFSEVAKKDSLFISPIQPGDIKKLELDKIHHNDSDTNITNSFIGIRGECFDYEIRIYKHLIYENGTVKQSEYKGIVDGFEISAPQAVFLIDRFLGILEKRDDMHGLGLNWPSVTIFDDAKNIYHREINSHKIGKTFLF